MTAPTISDANTPHNLRIQTYIEDYIKAERSPGFAVLLNGKWGCGKTRFMTDLVAPIDGQAPESGRMPIKIVWVSLYGVETTRRIDDAIFAALNPFRASKAYKKGAALVKGAAKGALKIDLDGDGTPDGTVNIDLTHLFDVTNDNRKNELVLVFDDIERCPIEHNILLGYLNHYIEQANCKVILIANEEKLSSGDNTKEIDNHDVTYALFKEKLVGVSFTLEVAFDQVVAHFIAAQPEPVKSILAARLETISSAYELHQQGNLRHLRHGFASFERLIACVEERFLQEPELLDQLLGEFLVLDIPVRAGLLTHSDVKRVGNYMQRARDKQKAGLSPADTILNSILQWHSLRYGQSLYAQFLASPETWSYIIGSGLVKEEDLNSELLSSRFFPINNAPTWWPLLEFRTLSQANYDVALDALHRCFQNNGFSDSAFLLHGVGLLLELRKTVAAEWDEERILKEATTYIDTVTAAGCLDTFIVELERGWADHYAGWQFYSRNDPVFEATRKHIDEAMLNSKIVLLKDQARSLLELLRKDTEAFIEQINLEAYNDRNVYNSHSVFSYFDTVEFVDCILNVDALRMQLRNGIHSRITRSFAHRINPIERDWFSKLFIYVREIKVPQENSLSYQLLLQSVSLWEDALQSQNPVEPAAD